MSDARGPLRFRGTLVLRDSALSYRLRRGLNLVSTESGQLRSLRLVTPIKDGADCDRGDTPSTLVSRCRSLSRPAWRAAPLSRRFSAGAGVGRLSS